MAGDTDAKLTGMAAEILRQAVEVFDYDVERWSVGADTSAFLAVTGSVPALTGSLPALTGSFPALTGSLPALTGSFPSLTGPLPVLGDGSIASTGPNLKGAFKLPGRLPATRLPSTAQLASLARSAPLMERLEALAIWLGPDGRLVTAIDQLPAAGVADAVARLGIQPQYLPYLLDYALTARWLVLVDEADSDQTRLVLGETAWRWADDDDSGTIHVWAAVFAALLARTLEVAASADPRASQRLKFRGLGVATMVRLFLARRAGLSGADVSHLIMSGAIGDWPSSRARRAWDGWVRQHGDPAHWLLGELAELRAIDLPGEDDGTIELTPLALWAFRRQLRLDGIEIPLLKMTSAQMTAATLVAMSDGVSEVEFEAEFASWIAVRGPDQAAHELLTFAAFIGPQPRLAAVNLVRRIGPAAHPAWRNALQWPELRGYARITLAAAVPESGVSRDLDPDPDDLDRVATDLLALACGEEDPDPQAVAAQFTQAIPAGLESWAFAIMSQSSHRDVSRMLMALGRCHPDRRIAKEARRAARRARRKRRMARGDRVPARASRR